ncbi:MAG: virulence RhuM family protein [Nanoarchaeota archaeon]|nr:virulence RhuM family protein [Nanoarchaeota archaeon]
MTKDLTIRNSTAEFLIFQSQAKEDSIEVKFVDGTVWLSQKMIAKLFDVDRTVITKHLKNIFESRELDEKSNVQKMHFSHSDKPIKFYNLDVIISVGYRVNSKRATQFRIWATNVIKQFALKGYVIDKKRLENGSFLNENYFDELLAEIREIRLSERNFYQKIKAEIFCSIIFVKT